jgi:hypothetical protein
VSAVTVYVLTKRSPLSLKIGIFYYVWYNPAWDFSWNKSKIIDQPILGYYDSSDPAIINQHIRNISDLDIDFVVVSWWGFYDDYGRFTDTAAKQVFKVAKDSKSNLKFAIMVEPFNKSDGPYNYAEIYNHVYDNFAMPFSSFYYNDSKPLICFFNDPDHVPGLTNNGTVPTDERFNVVLVGQQNYTQWIYTDLNIYDKPAHDPYNQTAVTPSYDDSHFRNLSYPVDVSLSQGVYDQEWENAIRLWKEGKIDTIMITSWNEYTERTAIEPHYNPSATNPDPWFLYNKTKHYIDQIKPLRVNRIASSNPRNK